MSLAPAVVAAIVLYILHTPSCSSFVPWADGSIALAFVDAGAAAYLGHLYSPISSGYSIGHLETLPGQHTWPGVPMGVLAQVQNRASERAFASFPYLYYLGDPRIAFETQQPYTITSDVLQGRRRMIQGHWDHDGSEPGVLPLRIEGGAAYRFVRVKGLGAVAEGDPFYNQGIQTLNVRQDKVALILHPDGPFEVELRSSVPLLWRQADALHDAFEFVWCAIAPLQSPLALLPLALLVGTMALKCLRRKPIRLFLPALCVGMGWATLQLVFCLLFAGKVSVSSYSVQPTPVELGWAFVGTSAAVALGVTWMLGARRLLGRLSSLGVCVAPSAAVLGLYAGAVTVLNGSMAKRSVEGVWPLNYAPVRMAAIVALVEVMVFLLAWAWLAARERPRGSGQASSRSMAYAGRLATGDDKDKSDRI